MNESEPHSEDLGDSNMIRSNSSPDWTGLRFLIDLEPGSQDLQDSQMIESNPNRARISISDIIDLDPTMKEIHHPVLTEIGIWSMNMIEFGLEISIRMLTTYCHN